VWHQQVAGLQAEVCWQRWLAIGFKTNKLARAAKSAYRQDMQLMCLLATYLYMSFPSLVDLARGPAWS
jgi:hypothetical protein